MGSGWGWTLGETTPPLVLSSACPVSLVSSLKSICGVNHCRSPCLWLPGDPTSDVCYGVRRGWCVGLCVTGQRYYSPLSRPLCCGFTVILTVLCVRLQKWPSLPSHLKRWILFISSLNLDWPCDLFWLMRYWQPWYKDLKSTCTLGLPVGCSWSWLLCEWAQADLLGGWWEDLPQLLLVPRSKAVQLTRTVC